MAAAEPLPVVQVGAVARVASADVDARVTAVRRVPGFVGNEDSLIGAGSGGYVLKAGAAADVAARGGGGRLAPITRRPHTG